MATPAQVQTALDAITIDGNASDVQIIDSAHSLDGGTEEYYALSRVAIRGRSRWTQSAAAGSAATQAAAIVAQLKAT